MDMSQFIHSFTNPLLNPSPVPVMVPVLGMGCDEEQN